LPADAEAVFIWPWQALSAALLAAWLFTLALWWRQRRPVLTEASPPTRASGSPAKLRGAILRRDPQAFEAALLAFAEASDQASGTLSELGERLEDAEQRDAIADYLRSRWRAGEIDWGRLTSAFSRSPRFRSLQDVARSPTSLLPPLYPQHHRLS
jgi:hypothetical protein